MRLIDADELLKYKKDHEMISTHLIFNAPTVDAEPIIRCRDCKHYKKEIGDETYALGWCPFIKSRLVMSKGYCSWAEKERQ